MDLTNSAATSKQSLLVNLVIPRFHNLPTEEPAGDTLQIITLSRFLYLSDSNSTKNAEKRQKLYSVSVTAT